MSQSKLHDPVRLSVLHGVATITVDEQPIGVVCIFGDEPRAITQDDERALVALAAQASTQLELRRQNTVLQAAALTDPLTDLPNRTLLFDRLAHALRSRRRGGNDLGVLVCDTDGFKAVNDEHGHEAGDAVLRDIARELRAACREVDTVARLGGDKFVVVCPDLSGVPHLTRVVERLRGAGYGRDRMAGGALRLSVGAVLVEDEDTVSSVLARADAAMYAVKAQGSPASRG